MSNEFAMPIYLDTTTLLDILGSIEDGFSMSNNVTTVSSSTKNRELSGKGGIDIPLLGLRLGGTAKKEKGSEASEERTSDRKYTYGSLLNQLRKSLRDKNLLTQIKDPQAWLQVNYPDFVEVTGTFKRNPVVNIVSSYDGAHKLNREIRKRAGNPLDDSSNALVEEQLEFDKWLINEAEDPRSRVYVVELSQPKDHRVIVSLYTDFLRDQIGNELDNGYFTLLGKVYRKVTAPESIDLLEKSSLKAVDDSVIQSFFESFKDIERKGIKVPEWSRHVQAPAMTVIPIAVYI
ncbi:MAG TPA: hypothetical protein VFZ55_06305 [Nitrososphaera sp.]